MSNIIPARFQHRIGKRRDLLQPLLPGEIGYCSDTDQVFIGSDPSEITSNNKRSLIVYEDYIRAMTSGVYADDEYHMTYLPVLNKIIGSHVFVIELTQASSYPPISTIYTNARNDSFMVIVEEQLLRDGISHDIRRAYIGYKTAIGSPILYSGDGVFGSYNMITDIISATGNELEFDEVTSGGKPFGFNDTSALARVINWVFDNSDEFDGYYGQGTSIVTVSQNIEMITDRTKTYDNKLEVFKIPVSNGTDLSTSMWFSYADADCYKLRYTLKSQSYLRYGVMNFGLLSNDTDLTDHYGELSTEDVIDEEVRFHISTIPAFDSVIFELKYDASGLEDDTIMMINLERWKSFTEISDFVVSSVTNIVNEGDTVSFNVKAKGLGNGTLYWKVKGEVNALDMLDMSGTVTIVDDIGTFDVTVINDFVKEGTETFQVELRDGSIDGEILATSNYISVNDTSLTLDIDGYDERFRWMYNMIKHEASQYFGANPYDGQLDVPFHSKEKLIVEAPDYGHETVSETVSFWVGLEAWKGVIDDEWSGLNKVWDVIDRTYIPSDYNQPIAHYNWLSPADYVPEGIEVEDYPRLGDSTAEKGVDPLHTELLSTYSTDRMFLMHWLIDVEGIYGFHNGDGNNTNVYINNYQRGMKESVWDAVTFPCWEDFTYGDEDYGFLPIFSKSLPLYPEAEFPYQKQWRYTCAPDAEARAIQWTFWGHKYAASTGNQSLITASVDKAKKMGDYLRYAMFDKYFRQIGNSDFGSVQEDPFTGAHYLVGWYVSWGGGIPVADGTGDWDFKIGSSECHQGYQAPDVAYFMASGGGGYTPDSPNAGWMWETSLYRQVELVRWLQSPEGAIAGGVTNNWLGSYQQPNDGRENAKFYGMYYTYAPVWHDPPSNNWFGFQAWGLQRYADLYLEVIDKNTTIANNIKGGLGIILDRFVNFVMSNSSIGETDFAIPVDLEWVSTAPIQGKTSTSPNVDGVYEYLPTMEWPGTYDYGSFWDSSTVPNPNLKASIKYSGSDLGVASSLVILLVYYAQAKRISGEFDNTIPFSTFTPRQVLEFAKELLDCIWDNFRDSAGIADEEMLIHFNRMDDSIYFPPNYNGVMPNGDLLNSNTTFESMRSFLKGLDGYDKVEKYLLGGDAPVVKYHRFWAQSEFAIANACIHKYFSDIL